MKRKFIKSADEIDNFEVDEEFVDEVSNSDEFADVEVTTEDVMDAVQAIEALADTIIEKANEEEKEIDGEALLDEIRDMIDESHEEDEEVEVEEDEELPEELVNSAVRVMVSEDGAIEVEQTPDEVYDSEIDGMECTMFDTCDDIGLEVEDVGTTDENTEDELLVIGNSATKKFKKGFVKLNSSVSKKAWSTAFKKVKKMIGNAKMTPAHWVIVSALAKKEEAKDKLQKKIECAVLKKIKSNKALKSKFLKSAFDEFDENGTTEADIKKDIEEHVGDNSGFEEEGSPTEAVSVEEVTSESGNPTEEPEKQVENENVDAVEEGDITMTIPLANSRKTLKLTLLRSSNKFGYKIYKLVGNSKVFSGLDGKCYIKNGIGYVFKSTSQGMLACSAKYVKSDEKGNYTTVMSGKEVVIGKGNEEPILSKFERVLVNREIASARIEGRKEGMANARKLFSARLHRPTERRISSGVNARRGSALKSALAKRREMIANARGENTERPNVSRLAQRRKAIMNARRMEVRNARVEAIKSRREVMNAKREVIKSRVEARRKVQSAVRQNESRLRSMHDAEERQRLFQSSQTVMNEEKIELKQKANKNADALNKMYENLF